MILGQQFADALQKVLHIVAVVADDERFGTLVPRSRDEGIAVFHRLVGVALEGEKSPADSHVPLQNSTKLRIRSPSHSELAKQPGPPNVSCGSTLLTVLRVVV